MSSAHRTASLPTHQKHCQFVKFTPLRSVYHKKKTHRASSVGLQVGSSNKRRHLAGVLTATLISSPWSISLHGTTAVRVALSGRRCQRAASQRSISTLLMFTDVWSVRGIPKSRLSDGVACRRSSFFASHRIIQSGLRQVQCQRKSCNNGHQPPSKNNKSVKLFRRGSFCAHVRQVDTNVVNQDNTPPALTTQRYHYHKVRYFMRCFTKHKNN